MACVILPEPTNEPNVLDMACVLLPEPTNESNCSGYGLHALTWVNQWAKLFGIWLACSYLIQPIIQIVRDMAGVILPEPTNEPNSSRYGLLVLTWANQVSKLFRIVLAWSYLSHQWAKLFMVWLAWSNVSQPMSQIVLDMACRLLPELTNEPNCSGYNLLDLTWANQWAKLFWIWPVCYYLSQPMSQIVWDMACGFLP